MVGTAIPAASVPLPGKISSMLLSLLTICIISVCFVRRIQGVTLSSRLPLTYWLVLVIYANSFLFLFTTTVFKDIDINDSMPLCHGTILLCLTLYLITKVGIYFFLVEKVYIVTGSKKPRMRDGLYLFNAFAMLIPYLAVAVLNILYRFAYINQHGVCIIGIKKSVMIPLISFDVTVNVYLTALFLVPIRRLYSYKRGPSKSLRNIGIRTFIGSCLTLTSTVINLTALMLLDGEPAWVCLMTCNVDVLFAVCVIHWVTSHDKTSTPRPDRPSLPPTGNPFRANSNWSSKGWDAGRNNPTVVTRCDAVESQPSVDIEADRIVVTRTRMLEVEDGTPDGRFSESTRV